MPSSHADPGALVPEVLAALTPAPGGKRAPASPTTPFEPFEQADAVEMGFGGPPYGLYGAATMPPPESPGATPDEVERLRHALDLQSLPLDDADAAAVAGTPLAAGVPTPADAAGTAEAAARRAPRISIDGANRESLQGPPSSLPSSLKDGRASPSTGGKSGHRRSLDAAGGAPFQLRETFTQSLTLSQQRQRQDHGREINQNTLAVLRYLEEKLAEKQLGGGADEEEEEEGAAGAVWSRGQLSLRGVARGLRRNHVARLFHQVLVLAQASRILAAQAEGGAGDVSIRLAMPSAA